MTGSTYAGTIEVLCGVMQSRLAAYTPLERDRPVQMTVFDANALQPETFKSQIVVSNLVAPPESLSFDKEITKCFVHSIFLYGIFSC